MFGERVSTLYHSGHQSTQGYLRGEMPWLVAVILITSQANQRKGRLTTANLWYTYVTEKEVMWEKS